MSNRSCEGSTKRRESAKRLIFDLCLGPCCLRLDSFSAFGSHPEWRGSAAASSYIVQTIASANKPKPLLDSSLRRRERVLDTGQSRCGLERRSATQKLCLLPVAFAWWLYRTPRLYQSNGRGFSLLGTRRIVIVFPISLGC